ncbi:16S rRNA (uracil(1498)-N(3))-methyltransferase [bacterium]|jgi:16S rRNA (uracil1498-N3)-methyltransferase|nr:16S rRNA (uracil(1498)-N(3))-methyltransferase [bacterium]
MHRLFINSLSLIHEKKITKNHPSFHHLINVLKLKQKNKLELCLPNALIFTVIISSTTKSELVFEVIDQTTIPLNNISITLCQSLPKGEKMSAILKMGTEIGIDHFQPVTSDNSVVNIKNSTSKLKRWASILESASTQSKQNRIPSISEILSLKTYITQLNKPNVSLIILNEFTKDLTIKSVLSSIKLTTITTPHSIIFVVGPEGGWSKQERDLFESRKIPCVSIGPTILRTEHAGYFAATCLKYELL